MNAFTSLSLERGKLKSVEQYRKEGSRHKVTHISYAPIHGQRNFIRAFDARRYRVCNYGTNGALSGPFVYEGGAYKIYTYSYLPASMIDSVFEVGSDVQVNRVNLFYDNTANRLNTRTEILRTDGKKQTEVRLYPQDYAVGTSFIDAMVNKGLLALPVEEVSYLTDTVTSTTFIFSGHINTYLATSPHLKDKTYRLEAPENLTVGSFKFSNRNIGALPYQGVKTSFNADSRYNLTFSNSYDTYGNLVQVDQTDGPSMSVLWGYDGKLALASASNAKMSEIHYQGFEELTGGTSTDAHAGLRSRLLNGTAYSLPVMPALGNDRKYRLSFWYKQSSGSWTYFTQLYTNLPSSVSGYTLLDELRIHPEDAQLQTVGYATARGVITYEGDERGRIIRYGYDAMGRLSRLSDNERHVLENRQYHEIFTHNSEVPLYFNTTKSAAYQRNDCTGGRVGESYTYVVPAGKYYSTISQFDADQKAESELALNGQATANLYTACVFRNTMQQGIFYRTNCPSDHIAVPYVVIVPADSYSSLLSQVDANQQAWLEVQTQGAAVNNKGGCQLNQVTIIVENFVGELVPPKQLTLTLTNTSTLQTYSSGTLSENQSASFMVPPGSYSISYTFYGFRNSFTVRRYNPVNESLIQCLGSTQSTFANLNALAAGWTIRFSTSEAACPLPP